jgi:hypothetical protein
MFEIGLIFSNFCRSNFSGIKVVFLPHMTFSKFFGCFAYWNWDLEPVQFEIKFQICKFWSCFACWDQN